MEGGEGDDRHQHSERSDVLAWDYQVWLSRCWRGKRDFFSSPVSELADGKHKSLPT